MLEGNYYYTEKSKIQNIKEEIKEQNDLIDMLLYSSQNIRPSINTMMRFLREQSEIYRKAKNEKINKEKYSDKVYSLVKKWNLSTKKVEVYKEIERVIKKQRRKKGE